MLDLTRRHFLFGSVAMLGAAALVRGSGSAKAEVTTPPRNLVLVVGYGGWDTTYVFDPKPGMPAIDAPEGEIVELGGVPIFDHESRPAVRAFFEAYGAMSTVVNGVQVQSLVHSDCSKRVLTGTASDTNPDVGAITAHELGRERPVPYFVLGQTSYAGPYASIAARAGTANQLGTLIDPLVGYPLGDPTMPQLPFVLDADEEELVRAHVAARAERMRERVGQVGTNRGRIDDFLASLQRGDDLRTIGGLGDLDYTRDLGVQATLAVNALERELSWAVQIETGSFDTHDANALQVPQHEMLFTGLKLLVDALADKPGKAGGPTLLDETVIAVVSEMGRTPLLNATGGKDHWPVTSALLLGGGLPGGRVLGGTTDLLAARSVDLATGLPGEGGKQLQYSNFAAGLLAAVGVDPAVYLPNAEPLHALHA
jgi:hypothetical protein